MPEPVRPEDIRASDVDRKAAVEKLQWAHGEGLITLEEFDNRVRAAWNAKTRGDLAQVSADLPEPSAAGAKPRRRSVFAPNAGGTAMRVLVTVWLSVSVVNLIVWGLIVLTTGHLIYPWWMWVALPPGAVLGVLWLLGIGRARLE